MIRWSFWVDSWEHPFATWSKPPLPDSARITTGFRQVNKLPRFTPGPGGREEPKPDVAESKPTKRAPSSNSWDWSKFHIPVFASGFTRERLPQPVVVGDDSYYSDEQLRFRQWLDDRPWLGTGAPPVVRVGLYTLDRMTYARGSGDLYSEDIATYEDSALVGGGGMVI